MPMPTPAFEQNIFYTAVGYLLGLAISMGFLYPMSRLVKAVVEEKVRSRNVAAALAPPPLLTS